MPVVLFQPLRGRQGDLGIKHDVEVGLAETRDVLGRGAERRCDADLHAEPLKDAGDLAHIVAMAKAERGRPQKVAAGPRAWDTRTRAAREGSHEPVERLRRAPVLLLLIGGEFERNDRDRQTQRAGETARIVLQQFGRA